MRWGDELLGLDQRVKQVFLTSKALGLRLLRSIAPSLEGAIILHPDDSADPRSAMAGYRQFAKDHSLQLEIVKTSSEAIAVLDDYRPDIGFVCGWYRLIPEQLLDRPRHGFFGIHNSLLPKYRGFSPLVWSILKGEQFIGSSLFRIRGGMDDGEIARQIRFRLDRGANVADALALIEAGFEEVFPNVWHEIVAGTCVFEQQDHRQASYCAQRIPDDGRVDWKLNARQIHDLVRGQATPYPGAYAFLHGTKVMIERTEELDEEWHSTPGQVVRIGGGVAVACGDRRLLKIVSFRENGREVEAHRKIKSIGARFT